jgi:hypothetical protein
MRDPALYRGTVSPRFANRRVAKRMAARFNRLAMSAPPKRFFTPKRVTLPETG